MQIKKAYKKLALKFHPDKALSHCRFAAQLCPSAARLLAAPEVTPASFPIHLKSARVSVAYTSNQPLFLWHIGQSRRYALLQNLL